MGAVTGRHLRVAPDGRTSRAGGSGDSATGCWRRQATPTTCRRGHAAHRASTAARGPRSGQQESPGASPRRGGWRPPAPCTTASCLFIALKAPAAVARSAAQRTRTPKPGLAQDLRRVSHTACFRCLDLRHLADKRQRAGQSRSSQATETVSACGPLGPSKCLADTWHSASTAPSPVRSARRARRQMPAARAGCCVTRSSAHGSSSLQLWAVGPRVFPFKASGSNCRRVEGLLRLVTRRMLQAAWSTADTSDPPW